MRKPKSAKAHNKQTRPDCSGNASSQSIPMTVEEYEALKRELARMRGFDVPEATNA